MLKGIKLITVYPELGNKLYEKDRQKVIDELAIISQSNKENMNFNHIELLQKKIKYDGLKMLLITNRNTF